MAQSLASDFQIYHAEFNGAFVETLQQNVQGFNESSAGTIRLVPESLRGHYDKESFFDVVSSLVARRDITSTSTAADTAVTQDEFVGVKLNRKVGPIALSLDALKKIGRGEDAQREASFIMGQQAARAIQTDYMNSALRACEAALDNVSALEHSATDGTLETTDLIAGLKKFGDAAGNIRAWVMHSAQFYDLLSNQVTNAIYRANGVEIMEGTPVTLGRPVVVTDSDALVETDGVSSGVDAYSVLGLVQGAIEVVESEPATMVTDLITGYENIFWRVQGEHAFNLRLRGFKWDVTNGSTNPTDATVATGTNWDKAVTSDKLLPGIIIKSR